MKTVRLPAVPEREHPKAGAGGGNHTVCAETLACPDRGRPSFFPGARAILEIRTRQPDGNFHIETGSHVPTYDVRVHLVKIGPLVLCAFSGELFASTGLSIKHLFPGEEVIVINHDCSLMANSGYIFEDDLIRRIEHSAVHVHIPGYDEESHLLPGYIVPSLLRLTEDLHRRAAEETAD